MPPTEFVSSLQASQAVFDAIPAPVFVKDRNHRLVLVNRAFVEMAGVEAKDLIGCSDADFFPPEQVAIYWAVDDRVLATGEMIENEEPIRDSQGRMRTCRTRKHLAHIRGPSGRDEPFVVAVINDVTEVREAEARARRAEALQAAEAELLGDMARGAPLTVVLEKVLALLDQIAPVAGSSIMLVDRNEDVLTCATSRGLPAAYLDAVRRVAVGPGCGSCGAAAHRGERVVVRDIAVDPLWDAYRDVALPHGLRGCWSTPIKDEGGAVLGTFAIYYAEPRTPDENILSLIDGAANLAALAISRKRKDDQLALSQHRLEQAATAAEASFFVAAAGLQKLEFLGDNADQFWGLPAGELARDPWAWLRSVHPEDREAVVEHIDQQDDAWDTEYRILRDGEVRWIHARGGATRDAAGEVAWIAGLCSDVTRIKEAEQAARANEERFQQLAQNIDDMFWTVDAATGRFLYISPGYERSWGRSAEALYADSRLWLDTVAPEDRARVVEALRSGEDGFQVEYRAQQGDGEYRWISTRGFPVRDSDGKVYRLAGLSTDVTRLKEAEQAARANEERFRQLAETIEDVFWVANPAGDELIYVSPAYEKVWGRSLVELSQNPSQWLEAIHEEDRARLLEVFADHASGINVEYRIVRPDGEVRWIADRGFPVRDASGETYRVVGLAQDVTDAKRAQLAVKLSRDLAETEVAGRRAILDSARDAIVTLDPQGRVVGINKAGERMLGYSESDLLGRDASQLLAPSSQHDVSLVDRLLSARSDESPKVYEVEILRRDGSVLSVDVNIGELVQPNGIHFVGVLRDSTERKRVERSKDEFVSTVSHELRTPLTSIAGSLGLLVGGAAGDLPERAARLVSIAESNSRRLVRLINDILDIEKMQSGAMGFVLRHVELSELTQQAIDAMGGLAGDLDVRIELSAPCTAPVRGDADRLMQVITNLLSNAAKFSPPGGRVEVTLAASETRARLSVRDRGPGVPIEFRDRIFAKFAQADSSDSRRQGGTGLGLAICKEIVERHGGRIWFDSTPGEGATFHVEMALAAPSSSGSAAPGARRLLLCEDDPDIAAVLSQVLAPEGFELQVASTIAAAEAALVDPSAFRGLLLDLRLPDGNGLDLLRRLRARPETRELPVIIVSATSEPRLAASFDVVDWIQKPIDPIRLKAALGQFGASQGDPPLVLHVDDDPDVLQLVSAAFGDKVRVITAESVEEARALLATMTPEVAILDLALADGSGLDLLPQLYHANGQAVPVVLFSARNLEDTALTELVDVVLTKSRTSLDHLTQTVAQLRTVYLRELAEVRA